MHSYVGPCFTCEYALAVLHLSRFVADATTSKWSDFHCTHISKLNLSNICLRAVGNEAEVGHMEVVGIDEVKSDNGIMVSN
jgi:hypothetical protein